ncbi:ABC transporter C member 14 [Ranunculus cassubicifolius]
MVLLPSNIIKPEYVGLSLSYGLSLNGVLFWSTYMSCLVENRMVSVERIKQFISIPTEASMVDDGDNWSVGQRQLLCVRESNVEAESHSIYG